jgi:primosomal protein N' (replication factor Y)
MLTGTVVETGSSEIEDVKPVIEVLDESPTFSVQLLELSRRVADYYLCSWGEVLQAAMPSGMQPNTIMRIHVERPLSTSEYETMKRRAPKRASLLRILDHAKGDVSVSYLQRQAKTQYVADQLDALVRDGWISIVAEQVRQVRGRMIRCVEIAQALQDDQAELRSVFDILDKKAPKQSLALAFVKMHVSASPLPVAELSEKTGVGISSIDSLIEKGYLREYHIDSGKMASEGSLVQRDEREVCLTHEQESIIETIRNDMRTHGFSAHLLRGVTGSGKTIVYQRLIDEVLTQQKKALLLVPEIALTPQLGDRFRALYGSRVVVLHSRVSMGERIQTWNRIAKGDVDVVIGARSAVFVDIPSLGLIIVDEEHEASYKQDEPAPRYHARDVAVMRAKFTDCAVVLGSATPSLESYHNALLQRYRTHELTQRADGVSFPAIQAVDLRLARKTKQMVGAFAVETLIAMADRIRRNEGVLVFLNKRGFAAHVQCNDCGTVPMCSNCDVALTYHKYPNVLKCHYCGASQQFHQACSTCGSTDVAEIGAGTQKLEEELGEALREYLDKPASIARMDADSTSRKGQHRLLLQQFSQGAIDVLVGTQMIAKGLDIDRCTLVVVVHADQSLFHADFRASERTMQLMLQVSGRAGRAVNKPGLVLLQTYSSTDPTMQVCVSGEQDRVALSVWYQKEHAARREVTYPPFARFIVIECRSLEESLAQQHAEIVWALLSKEHDAVRVYPPVPPSVSRVRNMYRRIIVIKNNKELDPSGQICRSYLRAMQDEYYRRHASSEVRLIIDIDARGSW